MSDYSIYTLDTAKQVWEEAVNCGDTGTRIERASRWNSYYAYLVEKRKQKADLEEAPDVEPDYFLEQLLRRNDLRPTDSVIDIGAGSGRYTLQFAKHCAQVTALDACEENIDMIRLQTEALGYHNVAFHHSYWETYQPDKMYDISFCSMCPAICTVEDILRMEQMTKRLCCMITIASGSYDEHRMRMLKELAVRPDGTLTEAIHYYNVLKLMGRQPSVLTHEILQEQDQTAEEIMERYPVYFSIFGIPTEDAKRYLSDYLNRFAVNGVLHEKSRYRLTMLLWNPSES